MDASPVGARATGAGCSEYAFGAERGNGKAAPWVRSAYLDVLFRPATVAECDYWMSLFAA